MVLYTLKRTLGIKNKLNYKSICYNHWYLFRILAKTFKLNPFFGGVG
jgi:hypothetical protein